MKAPCPANTARQIERELGRLKAGALVKKRRIHSWCKDAVLGFDCGGELLKEQIELGIWAKVVL